MPSSIDFPRRRILGATAASLLTSLAGPAFAQSRPYPNKPVKLVIPFPPGGATDNVGRLVGKKLSEALGQPFVISNVGGASGAIGQEEVARSPADGYTLVIGTASTMSGNAAFNKSLRFDPIADFTPLAMLALEPMALVVHPSVPAKTVAELIALAKSRPGALTMASFGNGTISHLAGELFKAMAGVDMLHVPYKGAGPAMTDLMGGQVMVMFNALSVVSAAVQAGKLRLLGVGSPVRLKSRPDVPTIAESGVPGYEAGTWQSLFGPARLPADVVQRIETETVKIVKMPDFQEALLALGSEAQSGTSAELAKVVKADLDKWSKIVKDANIKSE